VSAERLRVALADDQRLLREGLRIILEAASDFELIGEAEDGIAATIALSGGVVSSCGLVMAASFARVASNRIEMLAQSGFAIVVGVLVNTFLVRPLLVPAIATLLGRWNWVWPGRRDHVVPLPTAASSLCWPDRPSGISGAITSHFDVSRVRREEIFHEYAHHSAARPGRAGLYRLPAMRSPARHHS
jgi:hypothetical protein